MKMYIPARKTLDDKEMFDDVVRRNVTVNDCMICRSASTFAMIETAFEAKSNADYEDYYEVSLEEAQEQISNAEYIISMIRPYLESLWAKMEAKS